MKYLVRLAKSIMPASVKTAVVKWRDPPVHYPNWAAAVEAANESYASESLTAFRIARAKRNEGLEAAMVNPSPEFVERIKGASSFVDFGGSTGEFCMVIKQKLPHCQFTVVENAALVAAARELRPGISFADMLPDNFDVFYSSGTLQYLKEPYLLWRKALSRTRQVAFLARNAFSHRPAYTVQKSRLFDNGAGAIPEGFSDGWIQYPHQTISEQIIHEMAEAQGFKLLHREGGKNSGAIASDSYGADLLFTRITVAPSVR